MHNVPHTFASAYTDTMLNGRGSKLVTLDQPVTTTRCIDTLTKVHIRKNGRCTSSHEELDKLIVAALGPKPYLTTA